MSLSTEKLTNQKTKQTSGFKEDLEHLRQVSLLRGLDYECLKLLAMVCRRVTLISGDEIMVQGEDDGYAFLILSGQINVIHTDGDNTKVICQIEPLQFIGGCALLGRLPRVFTLQATEKTAILRLSRDEFQKAIQQFPNALSKITGNLVSELVTWDRDLLKACDIENETELQALGVSLI